MKAEALIVAGAGYHSVLAVFHLAFWKIFRWREALARLDPVNGAILQVMNVQLAWVFFAAAWLEFAWPRDIAGTALGMAALISIAGFWLVRAGGQLVFFKAHWLSWVFCGVFLLGAGIHLAALWAILEGR